MAKFKEGDRVVLPANVEEGWPEERGTVQGAELNGTLCVVLDALYRESEADDLLREVLAEDVVLEKEVA